MHNKHFIINVNISYFNSQIYFSLFSYIKIDKLFLHATYYISFLNWKQIERQIMYVFLVFAVGKPILFPGATVENVKFKEMLIDIDSPR